MSPDLIDEPPASAASIDPTSAALALRARAPLTEFNEAGVLNAADVHVAQLLCGLAGASDPAVMLACALAVRAPRLGHVFVDLTTVADTVTVSTDDGTVDTRVLPWPYPGEWVRQVAACDPLVGSGEPTSGPAGESALVAAGTDALRPLRLLGTRLYLDRYWREERQVAWDLLSLGAAPMRSVDVPLLRDGIARLFAAREDRGQQTAVASAVLRPFSVIAGGPGTGKTTTVATVIALLLEQAHAAGERAPIVALCAPTGKAAVRLQESVHDEAQILDLTPENRAALSAMRAGTIHRLLGWRPRNHSRFLHNRSNPLPHDVIVVDETSMVSLTLMARLLEAIRDDARLVLIGDVEQLTSIEAGAILRDVVGPAAGGPVMTEATRAAVRIALGGDPETLGIVPVSPFGDGITVLRRVHRYGGAIAVLADAIRRGDGDATVRALVDADESVVWVEQPDEDPPDALREEALRNGRALVELARAGDGPGALRELGSFRLLCAHRHGPAGVSRWTATVQQWLAQAVPGLDPVEPVFAGRPLMITRNDYELRLYNGDGGVIVSGESGQLNAVFERDGGLVRIAPSRLEGLVTAYAITIHRSQGSQFDAVAVILGEASSRILTRELLYTAVTRARERLILVATQEAVRAAVAHPVARATGLRERLWGDSAQWAEGSGTIRR